MYLTDVILVLYCLTFESLTIFHLQIKYEKEIHQERGNEKQKKNI